MRKNAKNIIGPRKAIWVTEKMHQKVKLMALKANTSSLAVVEQAVNSFAKQNKIVDTK